MIKNILIITSVIFAFSCSCSKKVKTPENISSIEASANKKYGKKYNLKLNTTKEYALVFKKKDIRKNDPFPTIFFSVMDIKTNKLVYEDIVPGGQITWISDYEIVIKSLVVRPKDNSTNGPKVLYKLNVKTLNRFR
jgi:hypothetical protein